MKNRNRSKAARLVLLLATAFGLLLPAATPADAVVYNYGWCPNRTGSGFCDTYGTLTLYYHPDMGGAASSFLGKIASYDDYCCWRFVFGGTATGDGYGQSVRNNAGSGCVDHPSFNYRVYYSPNNGGPSQLMQHASCANLNSQLHNNNASQDQSS